MAVLHLKHKMRKNLYLNRLTNGHVWRYNSKLTYLYGNSYYSSTLFERPQKASKNSLSKRVADVGGFIKFNISHFMGSSWPLPGTIKCEIFMNPPTSGHPLRDHSLCLSNKVLLYIVRVKSVRG